MRLANSHRLADRLPALTRQAQNERAVDGDAQFVAIAGELLGDFDAHTLLDVVQDLLVAGFITDQKQAQTAIAQLLQRFIRHIGLWRCTTR